MQCLSPEDVTCTHIGAKTFSYTLDVLYFPIHSVILSSASVWYAGLQYIYRKGDLYGLFFSVQALSWRCNIKRKCTMALENKIIIQIKEDKMQTLSGHKYWTKWLFNLCLDAIHNPFYFQCFLPQKIWLCMSHEPKVHVLKGNQYLFNASCENPRSYLMAYTCICGRFTKTKRHNGVISGPDYKLINFTCNISAFTSFPDPMDKLNYGMQ